MKCYHCNQNEADNRFWVNFMGQTGEVHLCSECMEKMMHYSSDMLQRLQATAATEGQPAAWFQPPFFPVGDAAPPQAELRPLGEDTFPRDAGDDVKRRRQISELKARLQEAVQNENYEEAALLRDQINKIENGVRIYDT